MDYIKVYSYLEELLLLDRELKRRQAVFNPMSYGLPDLLFGKNEKPGELVDGIVYREPLGYNESEEEYKKRRFKALKSCIEEHLFIVKDGIKRYIKLIDKQVEFIGDIFFGYQRYGILWKPRGGGGSLSVAILIFLMMIYKQRSFLDLAGSGEQAKNVYRYVCQFWDCVPELKLNLLEKEPLLSLTKLKNGVTLTCITASQKQARGKHTAGLAIDEGCQEDRRLDAVFQSAINGTMSEQDSCIVIASTFHVPVGFFQDVWDNALDKGFKRYKWDIYDTMQKCTAGLEHATADDPKALSFCRSMCPLTEQVKEYDIDGNLIGIKYEGCDGKARESDGWLPRHVVITTKKLNDRETFRVEFECHRPRVSGPIFGRENIERAIVEDIEFDVNQVGVVGIDWGYSTEGCMVLCKDCGDYIGVVDARFLSQQRILDWVNILREWQNVCRGGLVVYADGSHNMCNRELVEYGFDVTQVFFQHVREYAEFNLKQFFNFGKIKIIKDLDRFIEQLYKYRKNDLGKIIKQDDHGPDALEAAFLHWDFRERFGDYLRDSMKEFFGKQAEQEGGGVSVEIL